TYSYRRLGAEVHIETPWFLPDVTFRFEKSWSEAHSELLESISTPVVTSGALNQATRQRTDIAATPLVGDHIVPAALYSISDLSSLPAPGDPDAYLSGLTPVGVDSVIAIEFKPGVDDRLSIGETTPTGAGTQNSNDLVATYELIEASIRR